MMVSIFFIPARTWSVQLAGSLTAVSIIIPCNTPVLIVKPAGTGIPKAHISARLAPFSQQVLSLLYLLRGPPPKVYTYFVIVYS